MIGGAAQEIAIVAESVHVDEGALAELGCGVVPCDDLRAELGLIGRRAYGQGAGALSFSSLPADAFNFPGGYAQFEALTWAPGRGLTFVFAFVAFDPAVTVGTQPGTDLHPTLLFRLTDTFGPMFAHFPISIRASSHAPTLEAASAPTPATAGKPPSPGGLGRRREAARADRLADLVPDAPR